MQGMYKMVLFIVICRAICLVFDAYNVRNMRAHVRMIGDSREGTHGNLPKFCGPAGTPQKALLTQNAFVRRAITMRQSRFPDSRL